MALQIIAGGSGSGKSEYIYTDIIDKSIKNPQKNYIIVVPEQYTMATQKKLVTLHPNKGILNIDVVSFERLAYKVFEEVGSKDRPVLDDTGKNLIIRHILEICKGKLKYFGSGINKTGFVAELKSVVSELLQYDITPERLKDIQVQSEDNRMLSAKLSDIGTVYSEFKKYIKEQYITSEEILDVLCSVIERSGNVRRSEFVFDGFTGFTPIQYKLLRLLFMYSKEVYISVTIDAAEKLNVYEGFHNLFFMSKEMIQKLNRICDELHVEIKKPIVLSNEINPRFVSGQGAAKDISFLEKNIFRYNGMQYRGSCDNMQIFAAANPKEEIAYCISEIIKLTRGYGYHYSDIAIVSSDMGVFGKMAGNMCAQNNIPCFVDHKKSIMDNPFVEFIRGSLEIIERGYNYDSVFRYLRTGMTGIKRSEIDLLDNYCVAVGIRGSKSWHEPWIKKGRGKSAYQLEELNQLRKRIVEPLEPLEKVLKNKDATVRERVTALYEFIVSLDSAAKLKKLSELPGTGNEYEQLYKKVIELFDKLVELLGEEVVSLKEFNKIIDSGFSEIKVGLIPPTSDCVLIGDIERTRLDNIKVLFFAGVNEGLVPKKGENRSILSESDRAGLEKLNVTLSPSVREKAFIQRFYLYLLMTKTSQKLYISYSLKSNDSKSLLPSYLIRNIRQLFPEISVKYGEECSGQLKYVKIPKAEIIWSEENFIKAISENAALQLYGNELGGSISSFETFSSCSFAYFMQYGLGIAEREEYKFAMKDFGTVIHEVLEQVSNTLKNSGQSFSTLTDEKRAELVADSIAGIAANYNDTILKDNSRNEYMLKKMTALADRTIWAIGKQLEKGTFVPDVYELNFLIDEQQIKLDGDMAAMTMRGKIDRVDICEDENNIYVRVIDYKSGKSDFDLLKAYYGLKIQLMTYMRAALKMEKKKHPDKQVVPAGVLYYNIDDPIIDVSDEADEADIEEMIEQSLCMKGVVNSSRDIIKMMDSYSGKKSPVVPVTFKKDGEPDKSKSHTMATQQFEELGSYISMKSTDIGKSILSGDVSLNPYKSGEQGSCTYCPYNQVCGFTPDLYQTAYRRINKLDDTMLWNNIKEGIDENGRKLDE